MPDSTGQSLSEIIENYLKVISRKSEKPKISPRISKVKGSIDLPETFNYKDIESKAIFTKNLKKDIQRYLHYHL